MESHKRSAFLRNAIIVAASVAYWIIGMGIWGLSQWGDPLVHTREQFDAAMAARHREGIIIFIVEVTIYVALLFLLRRALRDAKTGFMKVQLGCLVAFILCAAVWFLLI
jgi:hypothetical protein